MKTRNEVYSEILRRTGTTDVGKLPTERLL